MGRGTPLQQGNKNPRLYDVGLFCIVLLLGLFDGADLASMGLALSRLTRQLALTPFEASICASAGLTGLLIGAAVCGRLTDLCNRKLLMVVTTLLLGVFSLITTRVSAYGSLVVVRFLAGLGMGGLYPLLINLCHASATPRFKSTAVSLLVASAGLGGLAVSFVAVVADWRAIFCFGGLGPLLAIPLVLGHRISASRAAEADLRAPPLGEVLVGAGRGLGTAAACTSAFLTSLTIFCMITWLPSLLVRRGFAEASSHYAIVAWSIGSILGNLIAGQMTDRGFGRGAYFAGYGGALLALASMAIVQSQTATFPLIALASLSVSGAQLVSVSLIPSFYPPAGRGTGVGAMVSCGRLGSICGPLLAGLILGAGKSPALVFAALLPGVGLSLILALIFLGQMRRLATAA